MTAVGDEKDYRDITTDLFGRLIGGPLSPANLEPVSSPEGKAGLNRPAFNSLFHTDDTQITDGKQINEIRLDSIEDSLLLTR